MFWLTSLFRLLYLCRPLQNNYSKDTLRVRWRVHHFELLYFLQNQPFTVYRLFTAYCLPAAYIVMKYFHQYFVSVGVTYVVRKKTLCWKIHMGFEQKEELLRDVGLHLIKY